jgi:hypothetical protein
VSKNPEVKALERKNGHISALVHMSTKTTKTLQETQIARGVPPSKTLQETQIARGVPPSKTIGVATEPTTRWRSKIKSARRNNIIMADVDKSFSGKAQGKKGTPRTPHTWSKGALPSSSPICSSAVAVVMRRLRSFRAS